MTRTRTLSTAWILPGVGLGFLLGVYLPWDSDILSSATWVFLGVMVFLVVSGLPLLSMGRAIAKPKVLAALFALNLLVVPLIAFV
ncbi:MAG: hypothetical protein HOI76_03660, partial [Microbacteriaceae bacterium]|nr:hypothetical protein [Microbacteriaceae bacterium]